MTGKDSSAKNCERLMQELLDILSREDGVEKMYRLPWEKKKQIAGMIGESELIRKAIDFEEDVPREKLLEYQKNALEEKQILLWFMMIYKEVHDVEKDSIPTT